MLYLAAGKLIQKVPTQLVFNIFGDAGRKLELCPSSALDPSETSTWSLLTDADESECAFLSSVGQTLCQEGDQRCLYSSCLDSCGGNSLCDPSNSVNNCSKYSLWQMQSLCQDMHSTFSSLIDVKMLKSGIPPKYVYAYIFSFLKKKGYMW